MKQLFFRCEVSLEPTSSPTQSLFPYAFPSRARTAWPASTEMGIYKRKQESKKKKKKRKQGRKQELDQESDQEKK